MLRALIAFLMASIFFTLATPVKHKTSRAPEPEISFMPRATDSHDTDSLTLSFPSENSETIVLRRVPAAVFSHGSRDLKLIALTFDACSTTEPSRYDERITNILIETGTPATLFLGGMWMLAEPEQTKRLASLRQFELANHTLHHFHLKNVSDDGIRTELLRTQAIMDSLTGSPAKLFRAPFGEYDDRVVRIAAETGLTTIQYDLASGDPDPAFMKETLIKYVTSTAKNGSIVVMHVNGRGWHTAEALPEIIQTLRRRGFSFVTVSDLMSRSSEAAQQPTEPGK
jgi:peptidoglycan/xylan/chitin deacetylase (PgdA/CDA1 family)